MIIQENIIYIKIVVAFFERMIIVKIVNAVLLSISSIRTLILWHLALYCAFHDIYPGQDRLLQCHIHRRLPHLIYIEYVYQNAFSRDAF